MNLGQWHPAVVHFAIALTIAGACFRVASVAWRSRSSLFDLAATLLLVAGTSASVVAARSGLDAHGRAEHVPGCADVVLAHEAWGLRARNVFLGVVALELVALALRKKKLERVPLALSALGAVAGSYFMFRAGNSGGHIVYGYAAGVGVRHSDPDDVARLLIAGFYHEAEVERTAGHKAEAFAIVDEMGHRFPTHVEVQLAVAESMLVDRGDRAAALAKLDGVDVDQASPRTKAQKERLRKRIEGGSP